MATVGKYLNIFIDEGRDLIKRVGSRLLRVEEEPGDFGALESALRMIHTLKGSSKMVGLDNISRAAHAMENRLKEFTAEGRGLSQEEMNSLFSVLDSMEAVLGLAAAGQHEDARAAVIDPQRPVVKGPEPKKESKKSEPPIKRMKGKAPDFEPVGKPEQSKPLPADGIRIKIDRIDRLQEQVEDLIVQKWKILAGLTRLREALGGAGHSHAASGDKRRNFDEERYSGRDLSDFSEEIYRLTAVVGEIQRSIMDLRMVPLSDLLGEYWRMVRDLSKSLGKEILLSIEGQDTEVDRNLLEGLQGPLTHLVRNAADHGIEDPVRRVAAGKDVRGRITIRAYRKPSAVVVEVEDDGRGLDPDKIRRTAVEKGFLSQNEAQELTDSECFYLLCRSGFTTRSTADEFSGRGVGLDAVKVRLERLRGSLSIVSEKGRYSIFRLFLPQSLSIIRGLVVRGGQVMAAFPSIFVEKCLGADRAGLAASDGLIDYEGEKLIPVALTGLFGLPTEQPSGPLHIIVLSFRKKKMAIAVDRVEREQELVVKNLDAGLQHSSSLLGISLLADGTPAPILDVPELYERWPGLEISAALPPPEAKRSLRILVVDDAVTSRHVESTILESLGHMVEQAEDGLQAIRILEKSRFDLVVTDMDMPHVDGIELVREIRRDSALQQIPVIMVTANISDDAMDKSYEAGVNAFLTKDRLSRQVLARSIRNLFPD